MLLLIILLFAFMSLVVICIRHKASIIRLSKTVTIRKLVVVLFLVIIAATGIHAVRDSWYVWERKAVEYAELRYKKDFIVIGSERGVVHDKWSDSDYDVVKVRLTPVESPSTVITVTCSFGSFSTPWGSIGNFIERHYRDDYQRLQ